MDQIGFIVGTGRCGTTILAQALNSHSAVCVPHELQIIVSIGNGERLHEKWRSGEMRGYRARHFARLIERCCPYHFGRFFDYTSYLRKLSYPQTDLAEFLTGLFSAICNAYGKSVFIEQTPWYGQRLDALLELFPGMKVIHAIRDGRDVALSFARTPWWSSDVRANLVQWAEELGAIREFGSGHRDSYLEIRYEDLVVCPEAELGRALGLFGLEFEQKMLDPEGLVDYRPLFKETIQEHRSRAERGWSADRDGVFFRGSLFAWKRGDPALFASLPRQVRKTLDSLGYEI